MSTDERFLGSFSSKSMRSKRWSFPGMELYATDKRIMGFKNRRLMLEGDSYGKGAWIDAITGHYAEKMMAQIGHVENIKELEKREDKYFEVGIDEISKIVITKPHLTKFGHVKIMMKFKPQIDLEFSDKGELEQLSDLMKRFFPSGVQVQK